MMTSKLLLCALCIRCSANGLWPWCLRLRLPSSSCLWWLQLCITVVETTDHSLLIGCDCVAPQSRFMFDVDRLINCCWKLVWLRLNDKHVSQSQVSFPNNYIQDCSEQCSLRPYAQKTPTDCLQTIWSTLHSKTARVSWNHPFQWISFLTFW